MTTTSFVLGNGRSRLGVDLTHLRSRGKIYGCNAIYRDFAPDVLVATDPGISQEIQASGYARSHIFYTRHPAEGTGARNIELYPGYSSGPVALAYAAYEAAQIIYLLGFDLGGQDGRFNNVYADTPHYRKSTDTPTYYGNWVNQIYQIVKEYPQKKFIWVAAPNSPHPNEWVSLKNFQRITREDFLQP